jgi:hypothetical protein
MSDVIAQDIPGLFMRHMRSGEFEAAWKLTHGNVKAKAGIPVGTCYGIFNVPEMVHLSRETACWCAAIMDSGIPYNSYAIRRC